MSTEPGGTGPRLFPTLVALGLAAAGLGAVLLARSFVPAASTDDGPFVGPPADGSAGLPGPGDVAPSGVASAVRSDPLHPDLLSVTDAADLASGWVLLDARGGRIHRLTPDGRPVLSFGRKGEGPGEFRDPAAVATHGDTILVVERVGGQIHRFAPDGVFLGRRSVTIPGCFVPLVVDAGGTESGPVLLVRCVEPGRGDRTMTEMAVLVREEGAVRVVWSSEPRDPTASRRTLFAEPLLATGPRTVAVGRQSTGCVRLHRLVGETPGPHETRCLPRRAPIPLPKDDRAFLRRYVEGLGERSPVRFHPPRNHPALYDLFLTDGAPVALVATADHDAELVRVSAEGPPRTVRIRGDEPVLLRAGRILEYKEELHGIRIRIAPFSPAG